VTALLTRAPFGRRDDGVFLSEMVALTRRHLASCDEYRRVWHSWDGATTAADLPFIHVGVFKNVVFRSSGVSHQRLLQSSGTSGSKRSVIPLDEESSALQSQSCVSVLSEFVGAERVPLIILDDARSLRRAGEVSARIAAAMSLRPLATEMIFAMSGSDDIRWDVVSDLIARQKHVRIYGFTSILWQSWAAADIPQSAREKLADTRLDFVHSGGWKKLEAEKVTREVFDARLLAASGPGSRVVDYYGLVEQVGIVLPLCSEGFRHVPVWADVIVRDAHTLAPVTGAGMLQLLNTLALGAPYHSVLTEDVGRLREGDCACGRQGKRFELLGRIPKAETRGCANV
jgi:phenylacetate-coenzyme A ligase PaaK-like adenylate-forming protein